MKEIEVNLETTRKILGSLDINARFIEEELGVKIQAGNGLLLLSGEREEEAEELIRSLIVLIGKGEEIDRPKIRQSLDILRSCGGEKILEVNSGVVTVTARGKQIKCKTLGQHEYVKAIRTNTIIFGMGPAGTGKTYLAVAMAYDAFKSGAVERIILTRPALEAGEKLGFLPGDMQEKIDPYLRPLYDALGEMFGQEGYLKLMERGLIEAAPLGFMRGRTLSNAFIILDEAQNTTREQMKMFLTRLGNSGKMLVTGDETQIDLPGKESGLLEAARILDGIKDIAVCRLTAKDVVRHELVQRIVQAYAKNSN